MNTSFFKKFISCTLFLMISSISYASSTVTVKNQGAYDVYLCQVKEETAKNINATAQKFFDHDSQMSALTPDEQNLLQDFCYKDGNCACSTMHAGKENQYSSTDDSQLIVAKPISGLGAIIGSVLAALAVALTFLSAGLAIPAFQVISLIGVVAGVSANVLYTSALVLTTTLAITSWVAMGLFYNGNFIPTTGHNLEAIAELPPLMISLDKNAAFVLTLFNGETLRFTGTSTSQSFTVDNDQIKMLAGNQGQFKVHNAGAYTMQACYERECVHLLAGQTKEFNYIPGQQLLPIIHAGPTPQSLMVRPNETIKFWSTVGTPYYGVENNQIPADTTTAPICVKGVAGIGYIGRACYGRECKEVKLTKSQMFNYEKDAYMSIKAVGGSFVRLENGPPDEIAFFSVQPGDTISLWGSSVKPWYTITPNTCKR